MSLQAQKATERATNAVRNAISNVPHDATRLVPKAGNGKSKPSFTMQSLSRLAMWASTAAAALFLAILTSHSDVGSERVSVALASLHLAPPPSLPRTTDAPTQMASQLVSQRTGELEATTRQLSQAVRVLTEDRDRLATRLATLERNVDDMTGSINRQIEAAKAARQVVAPPQTTQVAAANRPQVSPPASSAPQVNQAASTDTAWSEPAPVLTTPETIVAAVTPVVPPPAGMTEALPASPLTPAPDASAEQAEPAMAPPAPANAGYGIDLGGGRSAISLRARWAGIRSAHPQLFEGLEAVAAVRPATRTRPAELRLVIGPVASPAAAARLCASLVPFRLFCRPAAFGGDHLALR
jgi:hypothetical protein